MDFIPSHSQYFDMRKRLEIAILITKLRQALTTFSGKNFNFTYRHVTIKSLLVSFSKSLQFLYPGARVQIIQDSIEPLPLSTFNRELTSDDLLKKKKKRKSTKWYA